MRLRHSLRWPASQDRRGTDHTAALPLVAAAQIAPLARPRAEARQAERVVRRQIDASQASRYVSRASWTSSGSSVLAACNSRTGASASGAGRVLDLPLEPFHAATLHVVGRHRSDLGQQAESSVERPGLHMSVGRGEGSLGPAAPARRSIRPNAGGMRRRPPTRRVIELWPPSLRVGRRRLRQGPWPQPPGARRDALDRRRRRSRRRAQSAQRSDHQASRQRRRQTGPADGGTARETRSRATVPTRLPLPHFAGRRRLCAARQRSVASPVGSAAASSSNCCVGSASARIRRA